MAEGRAVIAAVDLTEIAPAVLRCAHHLAERLAANLLVLHVVDGLPAEGEGLLLPPLRRLAASVRSEAEEALRGLLDAQAWFDRTGVSAAVEGGVADAAIVERARCLGAELVVVGAPHPHVFPGSVAERVASRCGCPVLVVRRPPPEGYRDVMVGVDLSSEAGRAWQAAVRVAEPKARLTACLVSERGESDAEAVASVGPWLEKRTGGATARRLLESGADASTLAAAAAREGADLLAVGRGARGLVAEGGLGSVARRLVGAAHCDVLVAGGPAEAGEEP